MTEKRDIVRRLQAQQSMRSISSETGMHRVTVRKIRDVAQTCGWLAPGAELPAEKKIAEYLGRAKRKPSEHPLYEIHDKIEGWLRRNKGFPGKAVKVARPVKNIGVMETIHKAVVIGENRECILLHAPDPVKVHPRSYRFY